MNNRPVYGFGLGWNPSPLKKEGGKEMNIGDDALDSRDIQGGIMNKEVIRNSGDLNREVWVFSLSVDTRSTLYFDRYSLQTKETKRHKWNVQIYWDRLNRRDNNVSDPPLPDWAIGRAKLYFKFVIDGLPVTR